jgi:hypothetical protein
MQFRLQIGGDRTQTQRRKINGQEAVVRKRMATVNLADQFQWRYLAIIPIMKYLSEQLRHFRIHPEIPSPCGSVL